MFVTAANWKYNSILGTKAEIPEFRYRQSAFFGSQSQEWTSLVAQESFLLANKEHGAACRKKSGADGGNSTTAQINSAKA